MARRSRKRPYAQPHRPLDMERLASVARSQTRLGCEYRVQRVAVGLKQYTCPSCHGIIAVGSSHVVAWRTDTFTTAENQLQERRHWHTSCWQRGL